MLAAQPQDQITSLGRGGGERGHVYVSELRSFVLCLFYGIFIYVHQFCVYDLRSEDSFLPSWTEV